MIILILFAFIGGIITILSPCILPVLPIVLSGSIGGGKRKPLGIVTGFIGSFTFFTLFLSTIVRATGLSADSLRIVAIVTLIIFGLSLLIPQFQVFMEKLMSKLSSMAAQKNKAVQSNGFVSGLPVGASLGLLWTPCVGPILASVITLAATSQVTSSAVFITLAYALGTAIPMLGITYGGRKLLSSIPGLMTNMSTIQKIFGVVMIVTAFGIFFNVDRKIQTAVLTTFPQYGTGLTFIEDNNVVKKALGTLTQQKPSIEIGKPMNMPENNGLPKLGKAHGFERYSGEWINSKPLTLEELRGKVVLVDFWTYTCINCIRTLPYLKTWYDTYKDQGFVIVGVHTPEFEFEKSTANVSKAAKDFSLTYPIVQDNDYGIWRNYNNRFWPAKYLIDKDGYIRYTHFGEGEYDETEKAIQELLKEKGTTVNKTINNPTYKVSVTTPELYVGSGRIQYLVSPEEIIPNRQQTYTSPKKVPPNYFAFDGSWTLTEEYAQPQAGSKLILHFGAKEVFLVMKSKEQSQSSKMKLSLDTEVLSDSFSGEDVQQGMVTISDNRLYKLVKFDSPKDATIILEFLDSNVEVYAFTFG